VDGSAGVGWVAGQSGQPVRAPGQEREVVAALCEPVRDSTAEAVADSDDQQVAWIDGGAIGPGRSSSLSSSFVNAR